MASGFRISALIIVATLGAPPALGQAENPDGSPEPPADATSDAMTEAGASDEVPAEKSDQLIDATQRTVYNVVNSTSLWFDGFFGSADYNVEGAERAGVSRGLLAIGTRWNERDGTRTRARFRAQFPLPALKRRTRLLLGRGDTDDIVDGSETETINTLPEQFSDFADDDWLLGVGYRRDGRLGRGLDISAGASIQSSQINPYVRLSYRINKAFGDRWLWRVRPRLFWQENRGEGASLTSILDRVVNERWLLRSWITLITEDAVEGMGWTTDFLAYHSLNHNNALSYRVYATGETDNEVELQDYGLELRYRRRFLREWLFLELSTGVSWPKEFIFEERDENPGVGIELEMQFGDWPGRPQR